MAISKDNGRQWPLVARVDFALADLVSGVAGVAIDIPGGATILSGELMVDTVFNSGTSDVITVGDVGTAALYLGSTDLQAAARTVIVPTGKTYTTPDSVNVTWTAVGTAATTGAGSLTVTYVLDDRSNENG